jgi:hypothetical protein
MTEQIVGGPTAGSFIEQDSADKIQSDGRILERITKTHGQWILLAVDFDAMVDFHGLPETLRRRKEDDEKPKIWLPDNYMEKSTELEKWERVFRVIQIGTGVEDCPVKEGDLVLCKGTMFKTYSEPTLWYAVLDNIASTVALEEKSSILT